MDSEEGRRLLHMLQMPLETLALEGMPKGNLGRLGERKLMEFMPKIRDTSLRGV